jgi:beta-galactosidase
VYGTDVAPTSAVRVGERGLLVDGQEVPVYSGAVHYWRLERERWPLILDQVQALGFDVVETYVPWSVHETAPGEFDWGSRDPRKDVAAFMDLCEQRGLRLIVRPGPHINAELTDFGFPEWVLLDPQVQARTALNTIHLDAAWGLHPPRPFPVPSYASEAFYTAVGGWFDAVCPLIARHLAPAGCVVAVQSDNETCYLFFDQPYATDYGVDSLRLYRAFLAEQYGSIQRLNDAYGTAHASFETVEPPRDGPIARRQDGAWHFDWVAYKEYQVRWSVARCARMLRERGLDSVPIFHDVAFQYRTPIDIARMEEDPDIDWVGLNLYRPPWEHRPLADRARFLAGSTRLPFVPELGAGLWSHHPVTPVTAEHEFVTLSALMYGIKAFSFYMLVERERWQGSPITRHGNQRPDHAPFYRRLSDFLRRYEFWRFFRAPRALVLLNYDLGRFAAANSRLNYGHADLLGLPAALFHDTPDLGFRCDVHGESLSHDAHTWPGRVMALLEERCVDYDLSDTHLGSQRLARYPLVFAQSCDFMDARDQRRLLEYARAGGQLIVGPSAPYLGGHFEPCDVLAQSIRGTGIDALRATVERLAPTAEFRADDGRLEVIPHHSGEHTLLFISNPAPHELRTVLRFAGECTFDSAWREARRIRARDELAVHLPGYTVQIWDVTRD